MTGAARRCGRGTSSSGIILLNIAKCPGGTPRFRAACATLVGLHTRMTRTRLQIKAGAKLRATPARHGYRSCQRQERSARRTLATALHLGAPLTRSRLPLSPACHPCSSMRPRRMSLLNHQRAAAQLDAASGSGGSASDQGRASSHAFVAAFDVRAGACSALQTTEISSNKDEGAVSLPWEVVWAPRGDALRVQC